VPIEYKHIFEKMASDLFQVEERGSEVIFTCLFPLSISRFTVQLPPKEFATFARKLRASGGVIKYSRDKIAFHPFMKRTLTLKVTDGMLKLLKRASERKGQKLRTYCRNVLLKAAIDDLEGDEGDE